MFIFPAPLPSPAAQDGSWKSGFPGTGPLWADATVCVLLLQRFRTRFLLKHEHVTHSWMPWCIERKPETTSKTRRKDDVVLM